MLKRYSLKLALADSCSSRNFGNLYGIRGGDQLLETERRRGSVPQLIQVLDKEGIEKI